MDLEVDLKITTYKKEMKTPDLKVELNNQLQIKKDVQIM